MSQHHPVGPGAERSAATNAGRQQDSHLSCRPSKVQACHLQRQAIVYIRQSSPQQVLENRESSDRQYWQYQAVEPENRLVARELERRWEAALNEQRGLEGEYEQ